MTAFSSKGIARLVICFLLVYGLLIVPWPGLEHAYGVLFRAGGNLLFGSLGGSVDFSFRPHPADTGRGDTQLVLHQRQSKTSKGRSLKSRELGYMPTAVAVSLLVAGSGCAPRRWRALALVFILVQGFIAVRMGLTIIEGLTTGGEAALLVVRPFWQKVIERACMALVRAPASAYVIPIAIWGVVALRRSASQDSVSVKPRARSLVTSRKAQRART